jgi:hypothetical protein
MLSDASRHDAADPAAMRRPDHDRSCVISRGDATQGDGGRAFGNHLHVVTVSAREALGRARGAGMHNTSWSRWALASRTPNATASRDCEEPSTPASTTLIKRLSFEASPTIV